jgi:hypothetical protein
MVNKGYLQSRYRVPVDLNLQQPSQMRKVDGIPHLQNRDEDSIWRAWLMAWLVAWLMGLHQQRQVRFQSGG